MKLRIATIAAATLFAAAMTMAADGSLDRLDFGQPVRS